MMLARGALLSIAVLAGGCLDPVHDRRVDALGPEAPGEEPGPNHRPGQPCSVCHGGDGPGEPTFGIAGTVFATQDSRTPLVGAIVRMVDEQRRTLGLYTNGAGNFYASEGQFQLDFPLWVSVEYGGSEVSMKTPVFRATACAECHADPASPSSAGHVYFEGAPP